MHTFTNEDRNKSIRCREEKRKLIPFSEWSPFLRRKKVLEDQKHKCALCGQGEIWNNLPLILHLDHIDGSRKNNNRENFRALCPNCHTQTETYGSKHVSGKKKESMLVGFRAKNARTQKAKLLRKFVGE